MAAAVKGNTGALQTGSNEKTVFTILAAISVCHLLNDMIQSLIPAIYPILKSSFRLNFEQIGLITLTYQLTASLLQPIVGLYTDHKPKPFSLPVGMGFSWGGLVLLSIAPSFPALLLAAGMVGLGSSVFHPESSRIARMASGGQHGLAQSIFQVGGNAGTSLGPLLAAFIHVASELTFILNSARLLPGRIVEQGGSAAPCAHQCVDGSNSLSVM